MKLNAKKLAACAALLGLLALGTVLPASAAGPVSVSGVAAATVRWPFGGGHVDVESVELGNYQSTMTVGTTQQLNPVVLPTNASAPQITLVSENSNIIVVGDNGMIGAVAVGTTRVAATADGVTNYYTITVEPDPSTVVTDMDIDISSSTLTVGETANLSISVSPSSAASTAEVSFFSSNEAVATVNAFGKVTAVGSGTAKISVQCGDVVRSLTVTVKSATVSTSAINLNSSYVVLKPGGTYTIRATVTPSSAPQGVTFKSSDTSVATVSSGGVITAVGTGSTSILVSNGSSTAVVSVIVNRSSSSSSGGGSGEGDASTTPGDSSTSADPVVQQIKDSASSQVNLSQAELPVVTQAVLNALRSTGKTLNVTADGYTLILNGSQIKNSSNELNTALTFVQTSDGVEFTVNDGANLPGQVQIQLDNDLTRYARLYLYNASTEKWQYLNSYADGIVTANEAGRYLLTNNAISFIQVNWYALAGACVVLLAIVVVYIVVKKRYWFW